jgi:hypothetical protein
MAAPLFPTRALARRVLPWALAAIGASQLGCGANPWQPPPPRGVTYEYDWQGFRQSGTTVVAGGGPGYAYGGAFSFREAKGVKEEGEGKDPFAQSAPIDGYTFNGHLANQGARLTPTSGGYSTTPPTAPSTPVGPSVTVSASASASVSLPPPPAPAPSASGGAK